MMEYDKLDTCPYQPIHGKEWLEKYLKRNFNSKKYNQFYWWRGYSPKTETKPKQSSVLVKIKNGDFNILSYKYEAELVEHKLRKTWGESYPDLEKFLEKSSMDMARRKRLLEDVEKSEISIIQSLLCDLSDEFGKDKEIIMLDVQNSNRSTLYHVYKELKRKYAKTKN